MKIVLSIFLFLLFLYCVGCGFFVFLQAVKLLHNKFKERSDTDADES